LRLPGGRKLTTETSSSAARSRAVASASGQGSHSLPVAEPPQSADAKIGLQPATRLSPTCSTSSPSYSPAVGTCRRLLNRSQKALHRSDRPAGLAARVRPVYFFRNRFAKRTSVVDESVLLGCLIHPNQSKDDRDKSPSVAVETLNQKRRLLWLRIRHVGQIELQGQLEVGWHCIVSR